MCVSVSNRQSIRGSACECVSVNVNANCMSGKSSDYSEQVVAAALHGR